MPKDEALQKHTMNFYKGDFDELRIIHPDIPVSVAIREIVHNHVLASKAGLPTPAIKVNLELSQ